MKLIPTLALVTLGALMALPHAQAQDMALKAKIPFGFSVASKPLPPGEYIISSPTRGLIRFASTTTDAAAMVATVRGFHDHGRNSKIVFERYGDRYFLRRVDCPVAASINVEIPEWKAEKKARLQEAKLDRGEEILISAE